MARAKKEAPATAAPAARKGRKPKATAATPNASPSAAGAAGAPIVLTPAQNDLLWAHQQTQEFVELNCKPHIEEERRLRKLLVADIMPTPIEGTTNIDLGAGYRLSIGVQYERLLDQAAFAAAWKQCSTIPQDIFTWVPVLSLSKYRALTDEQRAAFDLCVTIKPSMPTVTVKPPQAEEPV